MLKMVIENLNSEDILFYNPISTRKILIVCKGNTCRSIMFHTIMEENKGVNSELFSAGVEVSSEIIEENTRITLNNNKLKPIKTTTNKIKEYRNFFFDDVIVMESTILIPDYIKYKRIIKLDIEVPFEKDISFYEKVFLKMKKEITRINF